MTTNLTCLKFGVFVIQFVTNWSPDIRIHQKLALSSMNEILEAEKHFCPVSFWVGALYLLLIENIAIMYIEGKQ